MHSVVSVQTCLLGLSVNEKYSSSKELENVFFFFINLKGAFKITGGPHTEVQLQTYSSM